MIQLRHDGEPGHTGKALAALRMNVADLPELMDNADGLVHSENMDEYHDNRTNIERRAGGDVYGREWYGGLTSVRDALALIHDGWAAGAQRAAAVSDGIPSDQLARPESIRRRVVWGEEGDRFDWQKALDGDHDVAWGRSKRRRTSAPRMVSMAASFGGNCTMSAEQLFWSGAQMVVTAEMLQGAGYQVEVRGISGNRSSYGGTGVIDITAKAYDEPLRVDMLAAVFSHAGVFRTYGFQAIVRLPWRVGSELGHSIDDPSAAVTQAAELGWIPPVDVFLPTAYNKDTAVKNIVRAIETVQAKGRRAA